MEILKTERLTFGHIKGPVVVKDFSCVLYSGLVLLCGEPGSGKTTLMNLLCGMQDLYYGNIYICGKPPKEASQFVSYLTAAPVAMTGKSVLDNLKFACDMANKNHSSINIDDEWIKNNQKTKFKKLSLLDKYIFCLKRVEIKNSKLVLIDQDLSLLSDDELEIYLEHFVNLMTQKDRLIILSSPVEIFKKMQKVTQNCQILYQNRQTINYFQNLQHFKDRINCYSMADYFDYKKDQAKVIQTQNGYLLNCENISFKLPDKFIKAIEEYFEVSDSTDVYIYYLSDWKGLSNSKFLQMVESSQILLFDTLSGEKLNK